MAPDRRAEWDAAHMKKLEVRQFLQASADVKGWFFPIDAALFGAVERLKPIDASLPVPHMGWNVLTGMIEHPVLAGLGVEPHVYFVHSYALNAEKLSQVAARCDYGGPFVAAVARDNIFGTQFHPEKSQAMGLRFIANFLSWKP